ADTAALETQSGAQAKADAAQAIAIQRSNHTGTQSADTLVDGSTNHVFTAADDARLANTSGTNTGDQTITLSGDVAGSGTGAITATIQPNSVALGPDTTGNYVAS